MFLGAYAKATRPIAGGTQPETNQVKNITITIATSSRILISNKKIIIILTSTCTCI